MTTLTAHPQSPSPVDAVERDSSAYRLSFPRLMRAEWIKFTTLRSTWWSIGLVAVVSLGLSVLMALSMNSMMGEDPAMATAGHNEQLVTVVTFSTVLTQLLAITLGVILITGEYSTGMIRSTLTATPRRTPAAIAKALVVGVTMFVMAVVVFAIVAPVVGWIAPGGGLDLSDPASSVAPLLGAALYLALTAVMGVGIGFIIRNGPGALAAGIGLLFVAPIIVSFFPPVGDFEWLHDLASYLPSNAGQSLFLGNGISGTGLDTVPALLTIGAWALAALVTGSTVLKMRDA